MVMDANAIEAGVLSLSRECVGFGQRNVSVIVDFDARMRQTPPLPPGGRSYEANRRRSDSLVERLVLFFFVFLVVVFDNVVDVDVAEAVAFLSVEVQPHQVHRLVVV